MWFKVELNGDGSVASCEPVESARQNGKTVVYIDALDKAEAMRLAKKEYMLRYNAAYFQNKKSQGCAACTTADPAVGSIYCEQCRERKRAQRTALDLRKKIEALPPSAPIKERKVAERKLKELNVKVKALAKKKGPRGAKLVTLMWVLREFDRRSGRGFRDWLVEAIKDQERMRSQVKGAAA
jgi:3'-phosphoadenosine 5'-phosphosulfate sulfotransferase (PAPS reductase)/FAD synthetase